MGYTIAIFSVGYFLLFAIFWQFSGLTNTPGGLKIRPIPAHVALFEMGMTSPNPEYMTSSRPAPSPAMNADPGQCKHPRVRVVAREEEAEFVECLECGDVFDSSEFRDMDIEESKLKEM